MISFFGTVHHCGGCGTEALGAVELLRSRGVPVRMIVPTDDPVADEGNPPADYLRSIGVEVACYQPGMFRDSCPVLMSFGEQTAIDYIRRHDDRPRYLVYSDCMGHVTDNEVDAHRDGLIDEFFFQTDSQARALGKEIAARTDNKPVGCRLGYRAFINPGSGYFPLPFHSERPGDHYRVGRLVRDDAAKWHPDTWRMFCGVAAPHAVPVQVEIIGWGHRAAAKIGDPSRDWCRWHGQLNITTSCHVYDPKEIAAFYHRLHTFIHVSHPGLTESLGRVVLEAMAAGTVVIADRRGGVAELIRDRVTGYLVDSPDEAAFRASELAFYPARRREIAVNAYQHLITRGHANTELCWSWWENLVRRASHG